MRVWNAQQLKPHAFGFQTPEPIFARACWRFQAGSSPLDEAVGSPQTDIGHERRVFASYRAASAVRMVRHEFLYIWFHGSGSSLAPRPSTKPATVTFRMSLQESERATETVRRNWESEPGAICGA